MIRKSFVTEKGSELPLLNLKGKEYLQVAHRLVWLDEKYPNYSIETNSLVMSAEEAVMRTKIDIYDTNSRCIRTATATKRETKKDFPDFIEKAETGSLGRALAMLGIGTQFCTQDLDEMENSEGIKVDRLADSPTIPVKKEEKVVDKPVKKEENNKKVEKKEVKSFRKPVKETTVVETEEDDI